MKWILLIAIFFGISAHVLDAFFAHGLKNYLAEADHEVIGQALTTASRYQLMASFFLLVLLVLYRTTPHVCVIVSQLLVIVGVLLFCLTIYLKHLLGFAYLAKLAPFGGIAFMLSFLALIPLMMSI